MPPINGKNPCDESHAFWESPDNPPLRAPRQAASDSWIIPLKGRADESSPRTAEEQAIRRTVAAAENYQNEVDPIMAIHTPDAVVVNIAGHRVLGKDAFRDAMKQALNGPLAHVATKIEVDDIRFVRPDVAIVNCTKQLFDEREASARRTADESLPSTGSLTYVMVEEAGEWRIALAQTTPFRRP
jgi:uncharacterized protein (TIGR02246 family)